MRIYAVADLHGSQHRLNVVLKHIEAIQPDLVVICGDLTQFGPADQAKQFLDQIPVDTFAVPGNIDPVDVGTAITQSKAENLDLRCLKHHHISFIGSGGDLPDDLGSILIRVNSAAYPLPEVLDAQSVLVTHVPPHGVQDTVFFGHHIGHKPLRELIEKVHPCLVLCGHVHEDPGFSRIGSTTVVNCSIGKRTEGAVINISDTIQVEILD